MLWHESLTKVFPVNYMHKDVMYTKTHLNAESYLKPIIVVIEKT